MILKSKNWTDGDLLTQISSPPMLLSHRMTRKHQCYISTRALSYFVGLREKTKIHSRAIWRNFNFLPRLPGLNIVHDRTHNHKRTLRCLACASSELPHVIHSLLTPTQTFHVRCYDIQGSSLLYRCSRDRGTTTPHAFVPLLRFKKKFFFFFFASSPSRVFFTFHCILTRYNTLHVRGVFFFTQ